MSAFNFLRKYSLFALLLAFVFVTGCEDEEVPEEVNELEVITDVKLIFTNKEDANDKVEARAEDPDGPGVQDLVILDEITLDINKSYTLTYEILNSLESPAEDIGLEIQEEDDEHQFFFSFTADAFASPTGDGNIDVASDPINYDDTDGNGNPLGYTTSWTTGATPLTGGTFTARLQHQPGEKTATSGANDGDSDFDLQFVLNIQ